jgi:hypothetical protein
MSRDLFETANRLWFREGRTSKALAAYQQALETAPSDPVVAFQLARALSAFDRVTEARTIVERASAQRDRLSPFGQRALDRLRDRLAHPRETPFPDVPPASLDRDRLDAGALPIDDWRTIADAAAARGMHGLAVYAIDRWHGVPIDAEDARDLGTIQTTRDLEESVLPKMYADSGQRG